MTPMPEEKLVFRPRLVTVAGLLVIAVGLAGCGDTPPAREAAVPVPVVTDSSVTPTPTETIAPAPTTPPAPAPTTPAPTTAPPVPTYDVQGVQQQLTAQKYFRGAIDGKSSAAYRSAVMAFQKVNGLTADGSVGKSTIAALAAPKAPVLKGGRANRVEVDLTKQVLYLVKGNALTAILPVSSGSGRKYTQKNGKTATALTPVGTFTVQRRIQGVRKADLGTLYDPQYFYKGWAIHGSGSVPAYPASHGCVRVTRADGTWLLGQIDVGWTVMLYGGSHTFNAGSKAAGTDNPTGDDAATTVPDPVTTTPAPTVAATPSPTPTSTTAPAGTPSASATPKP